MPMKCSATPKSGNCTMNMVNKESKMVVHPEVEAWMICSVCLLAEEEEGNQDQRKASQNSSRLK